MKYRLSLSGEAVVAAERALHDRFDGIGLIRGEYLQRAEQEFIERPTMQRRLGDYVHEVASAYDPRPVWYRVADLWSDEANPLDGVDFVAQEDNPVVGIRGIRRGLLHPQALRTELALLSEIGRAKRNLLILFPFVGDADEFSRALDYAEAQGWHGPAGSMVEIPSAVLDAQRLIQRGATNLLVGLNDLTCLMLGAARGTPFYDKRHRAVQWALGEVANEAGQACEWGIGGSLTKNLLEAARSLGAHYATLHYHELPELIDVPSQQLHALGWVDSVRRITRAAAQSSRLRERAKH